MKNITTTIKKNRDACIKELAIALNKSPNTQTTINFLGDLCTPSELEALSDRWQVAQLLNEGKLSYREINQKTGVSVTTITRVALFLREGFGGYTSLLK